MQVVLRDSEYQTKDIYLIDEDRALVIRFGGTGDLYWIINSYKDYSYGEEYLCDYFEITKENYAVYSLFDKLVNDIKNINIFEKDDFSLFSEDFLGLNKDRYRKLNMSHYNDLYNVDDDTICWVSDETSCEVANKVQIKKEDDKFIIKFSTQPYIDGYEREDNIPGMIGIRFRNSGSRYEPFNIAFMKMFRGLQVVDDVEDLGHQVHIEEYLYNKDKSLKKLNK